MPDGLARKAIVEQLDKNFFVIAGAGSGKTTMLVNRMVALVESGTTTIDKICAITFTVNAAAEFLDRLRDKLSKRARGEVSKEDLLPGGLGPINDSNRARIMANDQKALQNVDLCFAGTIDAFCNLALSEYPIDANIPSSSMVLQDEEEIKALYKKEYARLSRNYKTDPRFQTFVTLFKNPAKVFASAIGEVIEATYLNLQLATPAVPITQFVNDFKNRYEQDVQNDFKQIILAEPDLIRVNKNGNPAKGIELFEKFKSKYKKFLSPWLLEDVFDLTNFSPIFTGDLKFTASPCNNACLAFKYNKGNVSTPPSYSYDTNCSFSLALKELKQEKLKYGLEFLVLCANEVKKELKRQGKLTFSEYLYTFKELVKNDAQNGMTLINHIRDKFSYFLIDESQDTNPFQYELFLNLCSNSKPINKDYDLKPGSLFIVGDPKQSIYRFRNADIDSYNDVRKIFDDPKYPQNKVVELTNNYRSSAMLCQYFDRHFSASMPSIYTNITNANKAVHGGEGLFTFADFIDVIETIVDNNNYQIYKKFKEKDENGEDIEVERLSNLTFEDIMVITKKKKDALSEIAKKLDARGIPYYTEGDNILDNYEGVESLYATYCYLAYPNELRFFFNLMTSPLFSMKKEEVITLSPLNVNLTGDQADIWNDINNIYKSDNPVVLLKTIIDSVIFKYVSSRRMDYVYFLLNKLEDAYSSGQVTTLDDGAVFLFDLINEPQDRIAQMMYKPNAVYVANVHKVKGLEKPVVIMCKSGTNYTEKEGITKHMDYSSGQSYIFRLAKSDYGFNNYEINDPYTYSNKLDYEALKLKEEFHRLEYVAVTRARNYLFIEKSESDLEKNNCWIHLIDSQFQQFIVNPKPVGKGTASRANGSFTANNVFDANKNCTYSVVLPSEQVLFHNGTSNTPITSQDNKDALEKGTLVHALLETYILSDMKYSETDVVEETLARFNFSNRDDYRQMLTRVITTMNNGGFLQESGQKEDLFVELRSATRKYCEYPFSYMVGDKLYHGSIDLLYVKDGRYYVVDYKTNSNLQGLTAHYQPQLDGYKKALKDGFNIDCEARIYHIDISDK